MGIFDNLETSSAELVKKEQTAEQGVEGAESTTKENTGQQSGLQGDAEEKTYGKFTSLEALLKGYREIEKKAGRLGNELGQLRNAKEQAVQQPQANETAKWDDNTWKQFDQHMEAQYQQRGWRAVWEMVADAVNQGVNPINERFQGQEAAEARNASIENEVELLFTAVDEDGSRLFPDAESLVEQMDTFLERHPYFLDLIAQQGQNKALGTLDPNDPGALEILYNAVRAEAAGAVGKNAYQTGLRQGIEQVHAKYGAALPKSGAKEQKGSLSAEEQVLQEIFAHKKGGFFV